MRKKILRWSVRILLGLFGLFLIFFGRATLHIVVTILRDKTDRPDVPTGFVDDASHLDQTRVAEVWDIPANTEAAEAQLRALLKRAAGEKLRVSIAGARHSMGGHTIYPGGIAVNMLPFNAMTLNEARTTLHVGAGARWSEIIPYLNSRGRSVAVMQSNNSFSVGGSLSVNCHGWEPHKPPIAATVRAFRLMKADGSIVRCSRMENAELFSLALGGYGLFGIILDAELSVVPNERYKPECFIVPSSAFAARFQQDVVDGADVGMAYGRLSIIPGGEFLKETVLTVFHRVPCAEEDLPPLSETGYRMLRRALVRGSVDSDYGKYLRWDTEKKTLGSFSKMTFSRNQLLNEGVELYQDRSAARTDILHEYFVPVTRLEEFLAKLRPIIPRHHGDLLNVTVRDVTADKDTVLCYAKEHVFGLVMLFSEVCSPAADSQMETMTREMVDASLSVGGGYYLPYRLHPTREQLLKAYPRTDEFFRLKRQYDPGEVFQNEFYEKYGGGTK